MRASCVEAPAERGQELKELLDRLGLRDEGLRIRTRDGDILIPLERPLDDEDVREIREAAPSVELTEAEFDARERGPASLREALRGKMPKHLLEEVPSSFDVVGDVAIVEVPGDLEPRGAELGRALMETHPSVSTVLAKGTAVEGEFRTRRHRLLTGEDRRETVHREHGCEFGVNVEEAYFSPRLSTERGRVFSQVEPGEVVVDMFAGVGPFAVEIAVHRDPERVVAVDKNPAAHRLMVENVERNRVGDVVEPVLADAAELPESYAGTADRVIMNLPKSAAGFLDAALDLLRPAGGVLHYYEITGEPGEAARRTVEAAEAAGRESEVLGTREVRTYSATESQWAVDVRII
ncbi:MAG: tRNA (guanine(37)-N1)-methyltransferase Trm5b [Methanonatronarchaeales archaeon]|nr:tRNA (guanine(37)-N1)-methyltransferase Trm5b [Methanonatronarchaeales archaeon]